MCFTTTVLKAKYIGVMLSELTQEVATCGVWQGVMIVQTPIAHLMNLNN